MTPFAPKDWKDSPDASTPINAAALENLEQSVHDGAVTDATAAVTAQKGVANGIATLDSNGRLTGSQSAITVQDEGTALTRRTTLNFVGSGVTATDDAANSRTVVTIPGGSGGTSVTVQDEGSALTQRTTINFAGAGVTATDDAANSRTLVTIPGGGAGSQTIPVTVKTASYTPVSGDEFKRFEFLSASGTPAFTLPADTTTNFSVGSWFEVAADNANQATIAAASGVTVVGLPLTVSHNMVVRVLKRDVNFWIADAALPAAGVSDGAVSSGMVPTVQSDGSVAWQTPTSSGGSSGSTLGPGLMPTGLIAETYPIYAMGGPITTVNNFGLTSGQMRVAVFDQPVKTGQTITTLNVRFSSDVVSGQTHLFYVLYRRSDRAKLGVTTDALTSAPSANAFKPLNLQTPYVATVDFHPVIGVVQVATTPGKLIAPGNVTTAINGLESEIASGNADTGLTVPADAPATYAAVTSNPQAPFYARVS